MKKNYLRIGIVSVATLTIFAVLYFALFKGQIFAQPEIGATKPPVELNPTIKALNEAYQNAANAVIESVVNIRVKIKQEQKSKRFELFPFDENDPFFRDWKDFFRHFYDDSESEVTAAGSGVFITSDGYIVTNNHVIENADEIRIMTFDKKEYKAKVIGSDKWTDLAVIKVDGDGFKPVHFANSDEVKVGEIVIAVGNPIGLSSTVTSGIISAVGRGGLNLIRPEDGSRANFAIENFIQTDAPINPGNSGGGLFNLNGSLVGINTAIATRTGSYIGYGFAIPSNLVKRVASEIIKTGKFERAYLGVYIRTVDQTFAKALEMKEVKGAIVNQIEKGSPAEKAGIQVKDVILEVDGKKIETSNDLQLEIAKHRPGDVVELTILRGKELIKKKVKLETRDTSISMKSEDEELQEPKPGETANIEKLGLVVTPLDDNLKSEFNVKNGVYIKNVTKRSLIYERGLAPGGVILKVDDKEINSVRELKKIIDSKKPGDALILQIKYKDSTSLVAVEIPES